MMLEIFGESQYFEICINLIRPFAFRSWREEKDKFYLRCVCVSISLITCALTIQCRNYVDNSKRVYKRN